MSHLSELELNYAMVSMYQWILIKHLPLLYTTLMHTSNYRVNTFWPFDGSILAVASPRKVVTGQTRFRWRFFTQGQFWPSGIVIPCVCVRVCPTMRHSQACLSTHDNSGLVQAKTTQFGPEVQNNLVKINFGGVSGWVGVGGSLDRSTVTTVSQPQPSTGIMI